ncbi:MAG TPA: hypothetical protein PKZ00_03110 [Elusimicrobiota bacterium]|jgi:hypothetical protein|nr:hypothetical protein [Elusimicrobiota bacterium]HNI56551.1 hypothetical protein [Elusimicrobiota bacterium]
MTKFDNPLKGLKVASPCPMNWDEMTGDDRVRFCAHCRLNVFNLSALKRDEAIKLLNEKEGRLCVRFFRREDGTVMTRDCPVGLAALRQKFRRWTALAFAGATALLTAWGFFKKGSACPSTGRATVGEPLLGRPLVGKPVAATRAVLGDVAGPPPPEKK